MNTSTDPTSTDAVFRALADPSRRQMLDAVKARPGINVGELAEDFEFTRFAVMKHLKVLEAAHLIVRRREGKAKRLYMNAVPIQTIYDRWISRYSARWASAITTMKYQLEDESMVANDLKQVYVVYIRSSAEKVWEALTTPAITKQYFHNTEIESDWSVGSPINYMLTNEAGERSAAVSGEVLEVKPEKKLVYTFKFAGNDDAPSRVTYEIEPNTDDVVKLTILHDQFDGETETYKGTSQGWWPIVNGLKTLLETGEPLPLEFGH